MSNRLPSSRIDELASDWVARNDRGSLTSIEAEALAAWLAEDSRHLGAYARARAVFLHFDRASALGSGFNANAFERCEQKPRHASRRWFLKAAGGAVVAAAAGVAGVAILNNPVRHFTTRLGEVLRLSLEDGSSITLNSASAIKVEFQRARRLVQLLRGEALFDVAKDVLRPFVVEAGNDRVVAIGTSFSVQHAISGIVEVLVQEGSVEFAYGITAGVEQSVRLVANSIALASDDRKIEVKPLQTIEVSRRLAWRDGMISFDGDTLAQAATQFARYSDIRIIIDDPAIAARSVVGLYSAGNPEGFARAVAMSMDLRVDRLGDRVHLTSAPR